MLVLKIYYMLSGRRFVGFVAMCMCMLLVASFVVELLWVLCALLAKVVLFAFIVTAL